MNQQETSNQVKTLIQQNTLNLAEAMADIAAYRGFYSGFSRSSLSNPSFKMDFYRIDVYHHQEQNRWMLFWTALAALAAFAAAAGTIAGVFWAIYGRPFYGKPQ